MRAISRKYLCGAIIGALSASFGWQAIAAETSIPDFSGLWGRNFDFLEQPLSGPGPIVMAPRKGPGQPLIANHDNPLLKPEAAALLKKRGEISSSGAVIPDPHNQCWPEPTPFILAGQDGVKILQQKDEVILLYMGDQKIRHVRLNDSHPAHVTPTWLGDSVGHYEGDTLVIDTVGQKVGPLSMIDALGTPFSESMHVIERYRLIDGEAARTAEQRHLGRYFPPGGEPAFEIGEYGRAPLDDDLTKKGLQVEVIIEDPEMFTTPWSALVTYRPSTGGWIEATCAEAALVGGNKKVEMPQAEKSDF